MTLQKILLDAFKKDNILTRNQLVKIGECNGYKYYYNTSVDSTLRKMVREKLIMVHEKRKSFIYSYKLSINPDKIKEEDLNVTIQTLLKNFKPSFDNESLQISGLLNKINKQSLKQYHNQYKRQLIYLLNKKNYEI